LRQKVLAYSNLSKSTNIISSVAESTPVQASVDFAKDSVNSGLNSQDCRTGGDRAPLWRVGLVFSGSLHCFDAPDKTVGFAHDAQVVFVVGVIIDQQIKMSTTSCICACQVHCGKHPVR
jgi:hypothetical protein